MSKRLSPGKALVVSLFIFQAYALSHLSVSHAQNFEQPAGVVFNKKNKYGSVAVTQGEGGLNRRLFINGRMVMRSGDETARRASYPFILTDNHERVLILGLGTGAQVKVAASFDDVEKIEVVPANASLVKATDWFFNDNRKALYNKRVKILPGLVVAPLKKRKDKYDVILAGLTQDGVVGSGRSLVMERFAGAKHLLAKGGVMAQWLPLSKMSAEQAKIVTATFAKVFPYVTVWYGNINPVDSWIMLLGSNDPQKYNVSKVHDRLAKYASTSILSEGENTYSFLSFYICNRRNLDAIIKSSPIHSLKSPRLKFGDVKAGDDFTRSMGSFLFWNMYRTPVTGNILAKSAVKEKLLSYFRARGKIIQGRRIGAKGSALKEVAMYDKAREGAPKDPHLALSYHSVGLAYYRGGLWGKASKMFEKARDVAPERAIIRFYLGKTYEKMRWYTKAEVEFKKLDELAPGYIQRPILRPEGSVSAGSQ